MKSPKHLLSLVVLMASLCACSGPQYAGPAQPSGFLGDPQIYKAMVRDAEIPGAMVYRATSRPLAGYDSFIVPPVAIFLTEEGRARGVSRDDLQELAQKFRAEVIASLGSRYQVVDVPAARVAVLRLALTDAYPNFVLMNLPIVALITGGSYGGASLEAELVDSVSGRSVAAVMAADRGESHSFTSSMTKWGETDAVLRDWAKIIAGRIDQAHG